MISTAEYNRLMDAAEEVEDVAAFDSAMAEEGPNIPWDQVKADLGWRPGFMAFEIQVRPAAMRALKCVDRQDQARIRGAIALLAADPRPPA